MLYLEPYGLTDAGKVRQNNEDSMLVGDGRDSSLFVVADGIGGFEAGEVASRIAVDALRELEPDQPVEPAIEEANRRILGMSHGDDRLSGMGTTVVAVRFVGTQREPAARVAHVGDSRAYLMRGRELRPLTEDHSLVAELVKSGDLTRDQASHHPQRNLITRALGADPEVDVDADTVPVEAGDRFLLCSDGLSDMISEEQVSDILTENGEPEAAVRRLVSAALEAGGNDNVTAVIVDVREHVPASEADAADDYATGEVTGNIAGVTSVAGNTSELPPVAPPEPRREPEQRTAPTSSRGSSPRHGRRGHPRGTGGDRGTAAGDRAGGTGRAGRGPRKGRKRRRRPGALRRMARFVRFVALVTVVMLALTPVYLWGSSRYFLELDGGELVAYQGLPYAPLGVELNEEWRRTGVEESELTEPYRERIEDQQLFTQDQVEDIFQELEG